MLATFVIAAMGLAPGSPEQVRTEAGIVTLFAKYVDHPSGIVVYAATMAFLAIQRRDVAVIASG